MAKKIDLSGVKEFLFNHGEKVALGTCAFIALFFGTLALWRAVGASRADGTNKTWIDALRDEYNGLSSKINSGGSMDLPEPTKERLKTDPYDWRLHVSQFNQSPYANLPPEGSEKWANPTILSILTGEKQFDIRYVAAATVKYSALPGGVRTLEFEAAGGAAGASPTYLWEAQARRMVMVTAVFPMKQQVVEYQRAFKMHLSQEKLFTENNGEDLPYPVGIDVYRYEVDRFNNIVGPKGGTLVVAFQNGQSVKSPKLEELLATAVYDDMTPALLEKYIWYGLCTPMPKLAYGGYPRFNEGFDLVMAEDEEARGPDLGFGKKPGGGDAKIGSGGFKGDDKFPFGGSKKKNPMDSDPSPNPGGPEGKIGSIKPADLEKSDARLFARLYPEKGRGPVYDAYHVLGQSPPTEKAAAKKDTLTGKPGDNAPSDARYFSAWHIDPPKGKGGGIVNGPGGPGAGPGGPGIGPGGPGVGPGNNGPMGPGPGVGSGAGAPGVNPGGGPGVGSGGGPPKGSSGGPGVGPGGSGVGPGGPGGPGVGPGGPGGKGPGLDNNRGSFANWERDAMVRFVDPDVQPGRLYYYAVRVNMKNPNFNKLKRVESEKYAKEQYLSSKWTYTPRIYVGEEYALYAMDQQLLDDWINPPKVDKKGKLPPRPSVDPKATTFQVHQWMQKVDNPKARESLVVGDWVIADRVSVRRGERIGVDVPVQLLAWRDAKKAFEVPHLIEELDPKDKSKKILKPGMNITMRREVIIDQKPTLEQPPVLIDFFGGKRFTPNTINVEEESATEALVMTGDGKLIVHNSRTDATPEMPADVKDARKDRRDAVRLRIDAALNPSTTATTDDKSKTPFTPPKK